MENAHDARQPAQLQAPHQTHHLLPSLMAQTAVLDCPNKVPVYWTTLELEKGRELHLVTSQATLSNGTIELRTRATVYRRSGDQLIHSPETDFYQILDWKTKPSHLFRPIVVRVQHQAQLMRMNWILQMIEAFYSGDKPSDDAPGQSALWEIALSANRDPVAGNFKTGELR